MKSKGLIAGNTILTVVLASVVLIVVVGGLFFYFTSQGQKDTQPAFTPVQVTGTEKGDIDYQEPVDTVVIETKEVSRGNFDRAEGGNIYFGEGTLTELPLTIDEVALTCTTQNLASAAELDYNLVTKVVRTTAAEIGALISSGELIVVFASDVNGVFRAHTVALSASSCPK